MKVIGLILVFSAFAYSGEFVAQRYKQRCDALCAICKMLTKTVLMLRSQSSPVEDIISRICEDESIRTLDFIPLVLDDTRSGGDFREVWHDRLEKWRRRGLLPEDYSLLEDYGRDLGAYDLTGQLDCFAAQLEAVRGELAAARSEKLVKGRMCRSLGIISGMAAVLLML
jgi:stage III sporulation protein AB